MQPVNQAIHILAGVMELDPHAYGRSVVKGRQEVRQCGEFVIELAMVTALNHLPYHVAEQFALAVFGDQKGVHPIVATQRPDDMVGVARQPVIAHHAEIVEFAREA